MTSPVRTPPALSHATGRFKTAWLRAPTSRHREMGKCRLAPAQHGPSSITLKCAARASQAFGKVRRRPSRRAQTGRYSRVQKVCWSPPPPPPPRHGPLSTIRYPARSAMQALAKVWRSPPRRAQTGRYSMVQTCGPGYGGRGRGGRGPGPSSTTTVQAARIIDSNITASPCRETMDAGNFMICLPDPRCDRTGCAQRVPAASPVD